MYNIPSIYTCVCACASVTPSRSSVRPKFLNPNLFCKDIFNIFRIFGRRKLPAIRYIYIVTARPLSPQEGAHARPNNTHTTHAAQTNQAAIRSYIYTLSTSEASPSLYKPSFFLIVITRTQFPEEGIYSSPKALGTRISITHHTRTQQTVVCKDGFP